MGYKMKGFPYPGKSPVKQMVIPREDIDEDERFGSDTTDYTVSQSGKHISWTNTEDEKSSYTHEGKEEDHEGVKQILSARWKKGNKSAGGSLNELVKKRNTYTKGTKAWVDAQNKINKSLGSKRVHAVTVKTPKKDKKLLKKANKVAWGKGKRDILGRKKDKSKRNKKTWWNPWD